MQSILNLTQHPTSEEQKSAGVIEPDKKDRIKDLLTFESVEEARRERKTRADKLAQIAKDHGVGAVMIGGMPAFMSVLEQRLYEAGIAPLYAFSERESVEEEVDGEVVKKTVFRHEGFVTATESWGRKLSAAKRYWVSEDDEKYKVDSEIMY